MSLGIETAKEFIDYMYERVSDLRHNNTKDELTQIVLDVLRELQRSEYPELGIGIEVRKDELSPDILVTWGIEGLVLLNFSERKIDDEDKILFWVRMNEQGRDKRKETKGYIAGIQPKKAKKIFDKMNQVGREFVEVDLPTSSSYIFDQDINKCLEVVEEIIKICIKERVDLIKEENKELSMAYRSVQNCKLCEVIFAPHPTN